MSNKLVPSEDLDSKLGKLLETFKPDKELIKLLTMAKYFAFQFECVAPLYCVLCQPYKSDEAAKSARSIMQDVERAAQFRIEVEEYLKSKQIEI